MAAIVNLRQARKRKKRAEKDAAAETSRQAHGTPKTAHAKATLLNALEAKRLEGHRLDEDGRDEDGRDEGAKG